MDTFNTPAQPEIERVCEELLPHHRCGNCARWTQCGDVRMPDHGECEYRDVWQYSHRRGDCLLTPSSWVKKHAK